MDRTVLERKSLAELRQIAAALELKGYQRIKKADLVDLIMEAGAQAQATASAQADPDVADGTRVSPGPTASDGVGDDRADGAPSGEEGRTRARPRARRRDEAGGRPGDGGDDRGRSDAATASSAPAEGRGTREEREDRGDGGDREESGARGDGGHGPADRGGDGDRGKRERRRKNRGTGPSGGGGQGEDLEEAEVREGVLDLLPEGYGFLRVTGYLSGERDVYVSQSFVRRHGLRRGDKVAGPIRRNKSNDKFPALARVDAVEGVPFAEIDPSEPRREFADLTPVYPDERLVLGDAEGASPTARLIDLVTPIGKGQRGLIVAPPRSGKTTVLRELAVAIDASGADVDLMVVLVDERPEEVTAFSRATRGEVIASTFDRTAEDHTQIAELAIERAKRLAERGRDVVVLLDSLTRLGRAYDVVAPGGKALSGSVDATALYPPKRLFGAARNLEEGGSLTILATALVDTGARADELIFEEFEGTGNLELRLDRELAQTRTYPPIDVRSSSTRREDLLLGDDELAGVTAVRRSLVDRDPQEAARELVGHLGATSDAAAFLERARR